MIAGMQKEYRYDHLVVALGSIARVVPIPGLVEHAIGFKTIAEATALRNRIIRQMEVAEGIDDPESRRVYLSFVFIGGGYAGLEGIAELADFAGDAIRRYPRCREVGTSFTLIDVADRIMPEIQQKLADFTLGLLRGRGIEFRLGIHVTEVRDDSITLSTGETLSVSNGRLDGGRPCEPVRVPARTAAGPRPDRVRRVHARRGLSQHLGARRHRSRSGPRAAGDALPADGSTRDPPGQVDGAKPRRGDAGQASRNRSPSRRSGCLPNSVVTGRSRTSWASG